MPPHAEPGQDLSDGRPAADAPIDEDARRWLTAELSLVVTSRQELDADLERARRELGEARLEATSLRSRRSVRLALALARALGPIRRLRRRAVAPRPARRPERAVSATREVPDHPPPASYRSLMEARLAGPQEPRIVHVERADATRPDQIPTGLGAADIVAVTAADFDVRTLRAGAVSVAIVGPDAQNWIRQPWLDDYDLVVTASPASADAIREQRAKAPVLVTEPLAELRDTVSRWLAARRIGIAVGIHEWADAPAWGDLHFARAIQRQFEREGYPTRVHIRPEWTDEVSARDDASLHLFGLSPRPRLPGQLTLLWVISHPAGVTDEMVSRADAIYVASDPFAKELGARTSVPVASLHQATDPLRFHPDPTGPHHEVLFVGNSRGVRRRVIADLVPTTFDLAVYGRWSPEQLDPAYLRGSLVPNEELHRYYSSADVVLNDHWTDMRDAGFFSNRLYDAFAAGACIVSDHVPGIEQEFDGAVATYSDPGDLRLTIRDLLADPGRRRALADRGRAAVLGRHTFAHRSRVLLDDIARELAAQAPTRA